MLPIAVGIPTFTNVKGLAKLIPQLYQQTDVSVNLFLVCNHVDSWEECKKWKEWGARVFPPFDNIGVAAAWNKMANLAFSDGFENIILLNDDVELLEPSVLSSMLWADRLWKHQVLFTAGKDGYHAFCLPKKLYEQVGAFDEGFWPAYCLVPETPVLLTNLNWKPMGDLSIGDKLIATDELAEPGRERKFRRGEVIDKSWRRARCLRIEFEDGRQVVCTADHKWLTLNAAPSRGPWKWRQAHWLRPGRRVCSPFRVWPNEKTFDQGWLSGIMDGEGCFHRTTRLRGLMIGQKPGKVLDHVKEVLEAMGLPYTWRINKQSGVAQVEINARRYLIELLGRTRPLRLRPWRPVWEGSSIRSRLYSNGLVVKKVEDAGIQQVVSLETSTHTFIANGLVSHNCEDNDYSRRIFVRAYLANPEPDQMPFEELPISLPIKHAVAGSQEDRPDIKAWLEETHGHVHARYLAKWGGPAKAETFAIPWNGGIALPSSREMILKASSGPL